MVSRFLAQLGWDWIILDGQHGCFNCETVYECVHTIRAAGATPLVRITIGNCSELERTLDLGAMGIIVPMVNSREEAENLAQAAKYPPLGTRSLGGDVRLHYGEDYPERANRETLLLVQVEHIKAVQAAEAMLSLPGVDGCFVGPTDLAISMGISRVKYEEDPTIARPSNIQLTFVGATRSSPAAMPTHFLTSPTNDPLDLNASP